MNTAPSNRTDVILLCTAVVVGIIAIICGFAFQQYAISDFFDYGQSVALVAYSAIGFVLLCIWAFALDLPISVARRAIIIVWSVLTLLVLLASYPLTNPFVLGLDLLILLLAPLSVVCIALFGISIARSYGAKRRALKL